MDLKDKELDYLMHMHPIDPMHPFVNEPSLNSAFGHTFIDYDGSLYYNGEYLGVICKD